MARTPPPSTDDAGREGRGIACPNCGCKHWIVIRTWRINGGVRRLRECRHCGRQRRTTEQ